MAGSGREGDRPALSFASILGMGFELAVAAIGGLYFGSLLDRGRDSALFAPAGLLLGLLVGFHRAYMLVRSAMRKRK
ncbi:MAG: hypothetical protein ACM3WU_04650 [Bacillota bacterium]